MKTIPSKFYDTDKETPVAYTVGELIQILNELPADLEVDNNYSSGVVVAVYNHGMDSCCVVFEEPW